MIMWSGGKDLDAGVVFEFERAHGIELPGAYKDIVLRHDGARPDPGAVPFDGPGGEVRLGRLIPFHGDDPSFTMSSCQDARPYGLPEHLVAFGHEGGGYLFCFWYESDLRSDPPVGIFRHDVPGGELVPVSADFASLLELMETPDEDRG